ncbi:hypothetical protein SAMD00019534_054470 [Acytostelium subglobosum LB1]|uniref:hypothetical protein n=1 Tax=Acytostelium subglobosum LB1 TaxID=1410327 RepID=UPI0006450BF5|nr:hypothetical protein SAMD00019534_054470 [Acytostelium subglobosum LB1]GAM22272.1 hypothetical protein SAMD00019534_054470 [Acytostelium subglobosum LB1]|eukprot:XP_012754392.1 hypothetical protein SAMD00019534_054470 [Acytostelium subglobosum LB1]
MYRLQLSCLFNIDVTNHFRKLHELLVVEEHKVTSKIKDMVQQSESTIDDIINEIKGINALFKPKCDSKIDMDNMDNLVTLITTCETIDQFINQSFTSERDVPITITDTELLTMTQQCIDRMNTTGYKSTKPHQLEVDDAALGEIKQLLRSCFDLIDMSHHDIDN